CACWMGRATGPKKTKKSSMPEPQRCTVAVLTVSDNYSKGEREDCSGRMVQAALEHHDFEVVVTEIVPDERNQIEGALVRLASRAHLVVTTGGTGIAPRDVTPEATRAVCDRMIE